MWRIVGWDNKGEKWYRGMNSGQVWIQLENLVYAVPIEFKTCAEAERAAFEIVAKKPQVIGRVGVERVPRKRRV